MGRYSRKIRILSGIILLAGVVFVGRQYFQLHDNSDFQLNVVYSDPAGRARLLDNGPRDAGNMGEKNEVNIYTYTEKGTEHFECVNMHALKVTTPICIYNVSEDIWVSGAIKASGIFEKENIERLAVVLENDPDMELLDIGCNIGVYTLFAAKFGRRVVAVDANRNNLQRLGRSLKLGDLSANVTLVWNGISDAYETLTMSMPKDNNGAGMLLEIKATHQDAVSIDFLIKTITIEDIIPLVKRKSIYMKIDIEGSELRLFRGVRHFFDHVDVPYVQMEFVFFRGRLPEASEIMEFFKQREYTPFDCNIELNVTKFKEWPNDMLWVRKSHLSKQHCIGRHDSQLHDDSDFQLNVVYSDPAGRARFLDKGPRDAGNMGEKNEVNIYTYTEKGTEHFECVNLHALKVTTPICIYNVSEDIWVSGAIKASGIFEKENIKRLAFVLENNPDMELLDIGCNIGVYTLFAAKFGRRVVAVDANRNNLQRLGRSLKLGDLSANVTLVWNGISDAYETLTMSMPKDNNGAGMLLEMKAKHQDAVSIDFLIKTITIEDIIPLVKRKYIYMKIDIEGSELRLFRGVKHFFDHVDVPYVQMEFVFFRGRLSDTSEIIEFFKQREYTPFDCNNELNVNKFKEWPDDMLCVRKSHLNKQHCIR